jgi:hypothetical protein
MALRRKGIDYDALPESLSAKTIEPGDKGYGKVRPVLAISCSSHVPVQMRGRLPNLDQRSCWFVHRSDQVISRLKASRQGRATGPRSAGPA